MDYPILLYILLFIIAILYSSVGHGGASGYLALMGIYGISQHVSKPVALTLNCIVSLLAFIQFYRKGHFNWKLFLWLIVASIPMAFLGGLMEINALWYKKILGGLLIIASLRLFVDFKPQVEKPFTIIYLILNGALIGFISGLIGIGGGIILSPILLLLGWANAKKTAGISALFIFANSLAGLSAQFSKGITYTNDMLFMIAIAVVGGLIGSYLGANIANTSTVKKLLAFALFIAGFKLLLI